MGINVLNVVVAREISQEALDELLRRAQFEAVAVLAETELALEDPFDAATMSGIHRARALAHRSLGSPVEAMESCERAIDSALNADDAEILALARMTMAPFAAMTGDLDRAFDLLDAATPELAGSDQALALTQKGGMLGMIAHNAASRDAFNSAVELLETLDRPELLTTGLLGRGVVRAFVGEVEQGRTDLNRALSLFRAHDDTRGVAEAAHNLAIVSLVAGDPARAVVEFEEAAERWREADAPVDQFRTEYCEALLAAGLIREAVEVGASAAESLDRAGDELTEAGQRLVYAQALLAAGDNSRGRHELASARELMFEQGQVARAAFAELASLRLALREGSPPMDVLRQAESVRERVAESGNIEWRVEAELVAALAELQNASHEAAQHRLRNLGPSRGSFVQQVERLELLARSATDSGDGGGALRHSRRAIEIVQAANRLAGSALLRGAMTSHLDSVLTIGLSALLDKGRIRDAILLAERAMPEAESPSRVRSPRFVERRALERALDEGLPPSEILAAQARRRVLDQQIRAELTYLLEDQRRERSADLAPAATVVRHIVVGRDLYELRLHRNRAAARRLGSAASSHELIDELLYFLRRDLRTGRGPSPDLQELAAEVDEALGWPGNVGREQSRVLHLVPPTTFEAVPYGILPSVTGRQWQQVRSFRAAEPRPRSSRGGELLVAGGGLEFAELEVAAIAAEHSRAAVLTGAEASCETVLTKISGADLVHLAAHSRVNPGNVMFSSVTLGDGDLYLYELEAIEKPPHVVVLASCESARQENVGTNAIGLATGLLDAGIEVVVGTVCEIPDSMATVEVMRRLHSANVGVDPVTAIASLVQAGTLSPSERLVAQCLVALRNQPVSAM